jgi:hypothetical protein
MKVVSVTMECGDRCASFCPCASISSTKNEEIGNDIPDNTNLRKKTISR